MRGIRHPVRPSCPSPVRMRSWRRCRTRIFLGCDTRGERAPSSRLLHSGICCSGHPHQSKSARERSAPDAHVFSAPATSQTRSNMRQLFVFATTYLHRHSRTERLEHKRGPPLEATGPSGRLPLRASATTWSVSLGRGTTHCVAERPILPAWHRSPMRRQSFVTRVQSFATILSCVPNHKLERGRK